MGLHNSCISIRKRYFCNCKFILVFLTLIILSGCYRQWVSIGHVPSESNWRSEQKGIGSWFERPPVTLGIKASNVSREANQKSVFAISLRFYINDLNFKFDPREVRLILTHQEIFPTRIEMVSNALGWTSSWKCNYGPRQWYYSENVKLIDKAEKTKYLVPINKEACFEFYFPIDPPDPETSFIFRIQGLVQNDKIVELPEVHFKKGSFWIIF